jgi:hypothetical protein
MQSYSQAFGQKVTVPVDAEYVILKVPTKAKKMSTDNAKFKRGLITCSAMT